MISIFAFCGIPRLSLASVAEHTGLSLLWSQTSKDMFSRDEARIRQLNNDTAKLTTNSNRKLLDHLKKLLFLLQGHLVTT